MKNTCFRDQQPRVSTTDTKLRPLGQHDQHNNREMSHAAAGYTRHGGAPVPKAGPFYRYSATLLGATMWFWLFYRAKHDWKQWVGIEHPWDHAH